MSDQLHSSLISAVIPVHNRPDELIRAIRSVLGQTHKHLEVLVMDDASTVDLGIVVESFKDPRIRYFKNDQKSNANVMRNKGIEMAKGKFIGFLDSDDEWLPHHLEVKVKEMIEKEADGIFGSSLIEDGVKRTYAVSLDIPLNLHPVEYLLSIGFANTSSYIVKTESARSVMFDETLHRHQDYDFFARFALKYLFVASWMPTIVIHWRRGEARQKNAQSEIRFIRQNIKNIQPRIYSRYHLERLYAWQISGENKVIRYYQKESLRFIEQIAFIQYCSIYPERKGATGFVRNWWSFSFLIVKGKFVTPALTPYHEIGSG